MQFELKCRWGIQGSQSGLSSFSAKLGEVALESGFSILAFRFEAPNDEAVFETSGLLDLSEIGRWLESANHTVMVSAREAGVSSLGIVSARFEAGSASWFLCTNELCIDQVLARIKFTVPLN